MRPLLTLLAVCALAPAARAGSGAVAASSNPPFLGITMSGAIRNIGGCIVEGVTEGSPAQDAGLMIGDVITAVGGVRTPTCDVLIKAIAAHVPGEGVPFEIQRQVERAELRIALSTRAEVLDRRLAGHAMAPLSLASVDDPRRSFELGRPGRTTVAGWVDLEKCLGCAHVFEKISNGIARRARDLEDTPLLLGITPRGPHERLDVLRKSFAAGVPLATIDRETFSHLAFDAYQYVYVMVLDARGVVRFVATIRPDADDVDAAVDEVIAAVAQAEHARVTLR